MNLPNLITLLRILLIPILVIFLIEGQVLYALVVFICAAVSDALDGMIARVFKQKTKFGAYIDPIADKLLIGTSFVTLSVLGRMPSWLSVLVVSRDLIILIGIAMLLLNDKPVSINPIFDSKLTTLAQFCTVSFFLAHGFIGGLDFLQPYLLGATALFTLVSGFHYIIIGFRILGEYANGTR